MDYEHTILALCGRHRYVYSDVVDAMADEQVRWLVDQTGWVDELIDLARARLERERWWV